MAISLPQLVVLSVFVSAVLVVQNRLGVGTVGAALGTLAVCTGVIVLWLLGSVTLTKQMLWHWARRSRAQCYYSLYHELERFKQADVAPAAWSSVICCSGLVDYGHS
jgi:hypothetical protein